MRGKERGEREGKREGEKKRERGGSETEIFIKIKP